VQWCAQEFRNAGESLDANQSFNPKPEEIATIPAMDGVPLENTCGYGWHNSMYFAAKSAVLI
jgi:hypothetical protein